MKVKDLQKAFQDLNPETEIYLLPENKGIFYPDSNFEIKTKLSRKLGDYLIISDNPCFNDLDLVEIIILSLTEDTE